MNPRLGVFALQELGRGIAILLACAAILVLLSAALMAFLSSRVVGARYSRRTGRRAGKRALVAAFVAGLISGLAWLLVPMGFSASPAVNIFGFLVIVIVSGTLAASAALEPKRLNVVLLAVLGAAFPAAYYNGLIAQRPPAVDELERRLQLGDGRVVRFVEVSAARTLHVAISSLDRFSDADRPQLIQAIGLHRAADRRAAIVLAGYLDGTRAKIGPDDVKFAVLALANMGSGTKDALPALRRFSLDDRQPGSFREIALRALARMRGSEPQTVPVFIEALRDKDPMVRRSATQHLSDMGPSAIAAKDELRKLLEVCPTEEQAAIRQALGRIQSPPPGRPHGDR
jgi:hypothetical protein